MSLAGNVALVTGGSAGIGRATALAFARAGAKVAVSDINEAGGAETVTLIQDAGGEAIFVAADVTDEAHVAALVERTVATWGRLDCACNNAGVADKETPIWEATTAELDRVLSINIKGVFLCLKHEIVYMKEHGGGSIVNISSLAGLKGSPGRSIYAISKHGVTGLTRTAALECAPLGIRVNSVHPGLIDTAMAREVGDDHTLPKIAAKMHPIGRLGRPEEVAAAVVWLCSSEASFVTGHQLAVEGGYLAR